MAAFKNGPAFMASPSHSLKIGAADEGFINSTEI